MDAENIIITGDGIEVNDCLSAILVPDRALEEPGYIKTVTAGAVAHAKHEFHAMAQMAYYQYQDEELLPVVVDGVLLLSSPNVVEAIDRGMVIYRDQQGEFHVLIHRGLNVKKMLETTNRYCTRWVRLDI